MPVCPPLDLSFENQMNLGLGFDTGSTTKPFFSFQDLVRTPATPAFGISAMFAMDDVHVGTSTPCNLTPAFPSFEPAPAPEPAPELLESATLNKESASDSLESLFELDTLHTDDHTTLHSSPSDLEQLDNPVLPENFDPMPSSAETNGDVYPVMYEWVDQKPLRAVHIDDRSFPGEDGRIRAEMEPTNQHKRLKIAPKAPEEEAEGYAIEALSSNTVYSPTPPQEEPSSDAREEFKKALTKRSLSQFQRKFVQDPQFRNSRLMAKRTKAVCPAMGCNEKFTNEGALAFHCDNHERSELENRCHCEHTYCPRKIIGFTHRSALTRHNFTVHGEANFCCEFCDMRFARSDYLRKHQFRGHKRELASIKKKTF